MLIFPTLIIPSKTVSSNLAPSNLAPSNPAPLDADIANVTADCSHPFPQEPAAKLGWILIQKRWVSAAQLQAALLHQTHCSQKLGELLIEQAILTETQLKAALQEQYWRRHGYWVI